MYCSEQLVPMNGSAILSIQPLLHMESCRIPFQSAERIACTPAIRNFDQGGDLKFIQLPDVTIQVQNKSVQQRRPREMKLETDESGVSSFF